WAPKNCSLPAACAAAGLVSINRRNSFERTRTGRQKLGLHEIQRLPSLASPPPGTIMWTWGVARGRRSRATVAGGAKAGDKGFRASTRFAGGLAKTVGAIARWDYRCRFYRCRRNHEGRSGRYRPRHGCQRFGWWGFLALRLGTVTTISGSF